MGFIDDVGDTFGDVGSGALNVYGKGFDTILNFGGNISGKILSKATNTLVGNPWLLVLVLAGGFIAFEVVKSKI